MILGKFNATIQKIEHHFPKGNGGKPSRILLAEGLPKSSRKEVKYQDRPNLYWRVFGTVALANPV